MKEQFILERLNGIKKHIYAIEEHIGKPEPEATLKQQRHEPKFAVGEANSCVDCEKKDTEILELRLQLANEQTGNAELKAKLAAESERADVAESNELAILKEPDAVILSLKARIKELDDALLDSQAHLAWAEQDSKALSELRQAVRELIDEMNYTYCVDLADSKTLRKIFDKLEALLEKP